MPCPHHDIKIIQRSNHQSAVASAAYQSGERLFSEYDQKQKYYSYKSEIVHTEIMLPPHAPPEYADRNTLWNAAEAIEKQWNSQLARRIVLAIPREIPPEQHADLLRDYCREFFVSKGMIADFAIHDKEDGNPHAHILLTMRAMDENGKWLPKSRKVYDLDENGERIRLPSGNWKSHKEDTVDWNDQKYGEMWRQGWAAAANRYLEANDRPERLDLRSYERQGLDKIPTVHMGPAVSQMEKRGIQTNIGNSAVGSRYPDKSKADYYAVIKRSKYAGFPGLIVEHAYVSNHDDSTTFLNGNDRLKHLGVADATGIAEYFDLILDQAPVLQTPVVNADESVTLAWNTVQGADYYRIYRRIAGTKTYVCLEETEETGYTDTGVMPGTSYEYTVCGCHVGYQKDSYTKIAQAMQITVTGENANIQSAQKNQN